MIITAYFSISSNEIITDKAKWILRLLAKMYSINNCKCETKTKFYNPSHLFSSLLLWMFILFKWQPIYRYFCFYNSFKIANIFNVSNDTFICLVMLYNVSFSWHLSNELKIWISTYVFGFWSITYKNQILFITSHLYVNL